MKIVQPHKSKVSGAAVGAATIMVMASLFCEKTTAPETVTGTLDISYTLRRSLTGEPENPRPVVVWLEDDGEDYVRTLALSKWLSDDGYKYEDFGNVCKNWGSRSNWATTTESVDAITRATGNEGELGTYTHHTVQVDLSEPGLDQGTYLCKIEVGIIKNVNILCEAKITLAGEEVTETPAPAYVPEPPAGKGMMLGDVSIHYTP